MPAIVLQLPTGLRFFKNFTSLNTTENLGYCQMPLCQAVCWWDPDGLSNGNVLLSKEKTALNLNRVRVRQRFSEQYLLGLPHIIYAMFNGQLQSKCLLTSKSSPCPLFICVLCTHLHISLRVSQCNAHIFFPCSPSS